ncbi:MAG: hypothetical protein LUQ54_02050 [Methanoregula sp.]|nr:hypothetical protein [Methanoregula sp.]
MKYQQDASDSFYYGIKYLNYHEQSLCNLIEMVNFGLIIAGAIGIFIGVLLLAGVGALGTLMGLGFVVGGIIVFGLGIFRW